MVNMCGQKQAQVSAAYRAKADRVCEAIALQQPDCVPFVPGFNLYYAMGYGVSVYDCMKDIHSVRGGLDQVMERYDPDLLWTPSGYPLDPLELTGANYVRWPGETCGLDHNVPFQVLDGTYLEDDEYDEFIKDTSDFLLRKILPRKYKGFAGFSKFSVQSLCMPAPLCLSNAADPQIRQAFNALFDAAELTRKYLDDVTALADYAQSCGYPVFGPSNMFHPFDVFAGSIRGLINTVVDLAQEPQKVNEAVCRLADTMIESGIRNAKRAKAQYTKIPLHSGVDEFMSPANYERYYWPHLKRMIEALVEEGITPYVICEGRYSTRLETLCDVPRGKVIYAFESVDMARAKQTVGKVACIAGNFPTSALISGSREQVVDLTKKLIDDCAPGGGYLMTNSSLIDIADHSLMQAWRDTTVNYGKY